MEATGVAGLVVHQQEIEVYSETGGPEDGPHGEEVQEKRLTFAERLHVVSLARRRVVHGAGTVVGDVVAVESDCVSDELAQYGAQVHEGDVHQHEAGTIAEALEEDVADHDEGRPAHGEDAGQPHQGPEGDTVLPAERRVRTAAHDSLTTPRHHIIIIHSM